MKLFPVMTMECCEFIHLLVPNYCMPVPFIPWIFLFSTTKLVEDYRNALSQSVSLSSTFSWGILVRIFLKLSTNAKGIESMGKRHESCMLPQGCALRSKVWASIFVTAPYTQWRIFMEPGWNAKAIEKIDKKQESVMLAQFEIILQGKSFRPL